MDGGGEGGRAALLLQPDCARRFTTPASSTTCVEIKPKGALTSVSRLVPPEICAALDKFQVTPYAVKETCCVGGTRVVREEEEKKEERVPEYSPADLLSGEPGRIAAALEALRLRRAHSLRVFHDGAVGLADDLPIDPRLFPDRAAAYEAPENVGAIEAAARVLADARGVGSGIRDAQRRDYVDALGAEKVYAHLVRVCCGGDVEKAEEFVWDAYFADDDDVVSDSDDDDGGGGGGGTGDGGDGGDNGGATLEATQLADARATLSYRNSAEARVLHDATRMLAAERAVAAMSPRVAARVLADFMIASVVKDCSIMVSMTRRAPAYKPAPDENFVTLDDGSICLYEVSVVDLEPKPLSKLGAWAARDRAHAAKRAADTAARAPAEVSAWVSAAEKTAADAVSMLGPGAGEGCAEAAGRQRSASCQPCGSRVAAAAGKPRSASQPRRSASILKQQGERKAQQQQVIYVDASSTPSQFAVC